ncbi:formate/nitrite transporter family protein [Clostridium sp. D2Q-11]|uniref:Formate/nitrite transporter family protein n=2 Tax=Anaeromonas frigoriresistens TaxID=2683708 RepID=A0A942UWW8_9FIRM|nr:formate/nitrite transporter family protein [Anaeromonas frigoriresistens]MBS4537886.1 formate/nitrite transporter family protein [Anaeromonas frigoriresistens]
MEKGMLKPNEIVKATINAGINKAKLSSLQMILLGILAGIFIGFGAHANIAISQTLGRFDIGVATFMGAAVFPVGLMLVLIAGAELFTGNNLMTLALMDRKITFSQLSKNWSLVYIGNFIGSILLAYIISESGLYESNSDIANRAIGISEARVGFTFQAALLRGILCNIIVVLAVWLSSASQNVIGKLFSIWFPIMLFVVSGFEHSVANMFFLSMGKFLGANITWSEIWINNLIPVTLGNIIGGAIIIPGIYYLIYVYKK